MPELTPRQRKELETTVKHLGWAMKSLARANLPAIPQTGDKAGWAFHDAERRLGQASNRLIDGLEAL